MRRASSLLALALLLAGRTTAAAVFTETFDGGGNVGSWSYGTGGEVIETTGGNPGAYLHEPLVDTFAPQPHTSGSSRFTGDYVSRDISRIGIDLVTHAVDFSAAGRNLSLLLVSDSGTPGDPDDDWAAYVVGASNIPLPGEGWLPYSFDVPSQSATLPPGWSTLDLGPSPPPVKDWAALMADVAEVRFFYGDPTLFYIYQQWDVGLDNVEIEGATVPVELTSFSVE